MVIISICYRPHLITNTNSTLGAKNTQLFYQSCDKDDMNAFTTSVTPPAPAISALMAATGAGALGGPASPSTAYIDYQFVAALNSTGSLDGGYALAREYADLTRLDPTAVPNAAALFSSGLSTVDEGSEGSSLGWEEGGGWDSSGGKILTSAEALRRMCELQPDKPIRYGLLKTFGGFGLLGLGTATTWAMWTQKLYKPLGNDWLGWITTGLIMLLAAVFTICGFGGGIYFLADGLTALTKPLRDIDMLCQDVYYRNGGFINRPTKFDKHFGTKVTPLDSINDETRQLSGSLFLNGVIIDETELTNRTEVSMIGSVPSTRTIYTASMNGSINDSPLKAYYETGSESSANKLARRAEGSAIYMMGPLQKDGWIKIEQFGDALKG